MRGRGRATDDQFIQLTEGVIAEETLGDPIDASPRGRWLDSRRPAGRRDRTVIERVDRRRRRSVPRVGLVLPGHPSSASPASARATGCTSTRRAATSSSAPTAATRARTARRTCSTWAGSRRATTRRCRGCLLARLGGLARDRRAGRALRARRRDARCPRAGPPGRCGCTCSAHPTPAARLRAFLRLHGRSRRCCPSGRYGHWKSRDVYEHQRDVEDDFDGYRGALAAARRDRARLAVGDAIQHVGVQPAPVPGRARADRADARRRRAHRRVGHAVGEPRLERRPAPA